MKDMSRRRIIFHVKSLKIFASLLAEVLHYIAKGGQEVLQVLLDGLTSRSLLYLKPVSHVVEMIFRVIAMRAEEFTHQVTQHPWYALGTYATM